MQTWVKGRRTPKTISPGGDANMAEVKREELFDKVKDIIVEQLGVEPDKVIEEARFREDLEADSLDLVELIMEFEDVFGGEISDEEAQQIRTVGGAVDYLEQRMETGE
jgi:acyl carrier protein